MAKVTVYSSQTCRYCDKVKAWLKKHKIEYGDINARKDKKAAEEAVKKSGQDGLPVIVIKNGKEKVLYGWEEDELEEAFLK